MFENAIPAATTTIANIGEYSSPFFNEFLPIIYISLGILVGASLVVFVVRSVTHGVGSMTHYSSWKNESSLEEADRKWYHFR